MIEPWSERPEELSGAAGGAFLVWCLFGDILNIMK